MRVSSIPPTQILLARPGSPPLSLRLIISIGSVIVITVLLLLVRDTMQPPTPSLLYLLAVLISAIQFGFWPGIVTSVLAFMAFNYYFIPPHQALGFTSLEDAIRLAVFFTVAVLSSGLAGRAYRHAITAEQRASELSTLYQLSQAISAEVATERILPVIVKTTLYLLDILDCRILLYDSAGNLVEHASSGVTSSAAKPVDIPLRQGTTTLGVLRVIQKPHEEPLTPAVYALLQMIANQIVLVLERSSLVAAASQAQALSESNRLKSALLSSVSHDLRTPLAVIKGAVTNLLDDAVLWTPAERSEFLVTINDETDRLNRLVGELLVMSRIETDALQSIINWHDLGDLVESVIARLQPRLEHYHIKLDLPADLPPVPISYTQIDHVLANLLENAACYTPEGTCIVVRASLQEHAVQIEVLDEGPGISEPMLKHIFEKFARGVASERHAAGSGLGLAICKGLVEAHHGRIWAENRPEGGARFIVQLPLVSPHIVPANPDEHQRERWKAHSE